MGKQILLMKLSILTDSANFSKTAFWWELQREERQFQYESHFMVFGDERSYRCRDQNVSNGYA